MNKFFLFMVSAIVIFQGCTMAPKYARPDAPVPKQWPEGPAYENIDRVNDPSAIAGMQWQAFFVDEKLQEVIEVALENNRDLRLAALNVKRAQAVYGIQRAELFPAVNATANASRTRLPADLSSSGKDNIAEQYDVGLGVFAWEIDFFGRIRSLKDSALEEFLATDHARRSTQILIISAVADAYLTLAADRENLSLAETTYDTQKESYDLVKRRYDVGLATELDLNRAQIQMDVARGDIARFTRMVAIDVNALNLLAGVPVLEASQPENLAEVKPFKKIFAGISSEVLLSRPDILQAESMLKAANANIGAARAALFPRISLTTSYGTASSELSGLFNSGQSTWNFAPGIVLPIFDARLWSALDATKAEREIILVRYEKAIQSAFREVADALAVSGTIDQQLAAQQSLVNATVETGRLADIRYNKGVDDYFSVLDTRRSTYEAQQGLVSLRLAKFGNQVNFYKVLGGNVASGAEKEE